MAWLTEEQRIIAQQATSWAAERAPVREFRAMRDAGSVQCFDPVLWNEMVQLGWSGMLVPEAYGGSALDYLSFGLVLEQLGRELVASPLLGSSLVGVSALLLAGDAAQCESVLPGIARGDAVLALALDETPRHAPMEAALAAREASGTVTLHGAKTFVPEGMAATHFIVSARSSGGQLGLFLVPAASAGLSRSPMRTFDSRGYALLSLEGVSVPASARLGEEDVSLVLQQILDRAAAGAAMEMLGTASRAFDMTLDYLKTRRQFGQIIGGFQALGHRAAALYSTMELTRSCVEAALQGLDEGADDASELCALAKASAGEFLFQMSNELIQMHGGIGMTDEFDAGLYLKRARVVEALFGNRAFHRDRYARLLGF